ncbi:hypothetical protein M1D80_11875 [Phyllobacteriaceae bacterium JZ32]
MARKSNDEAQAENGGKAETQPANADQANSAAVGTVDLGSDTATDGSGELADAGTKDGAKALSDGAPTPAAHEPNQNAESSSGRTVLTASVPEAPKDAAIYRPLMTVENIAQAADEAAYAVAIQAGAHIGAMDPADLTVARQAVQFLQVWPDASAEAMFLHIQRSLRPGVRATAWKQLDPGFHIALNIMRVVIVECLHAERHRRLRWEAEQQYPRSTPVERDELAMVPDDGDPLSELGRAAASRE